MFLITVTVQFLLRINSLPVTGFGQNSSRNGSRLDLGGSREANWSRRRPGEARRGPDIGQIHTVYQSQIFNYCNKNITVTVQFILQINIAILKIV